MTGKVSEYQQESYLFNVLSLETDQDGNLMMNCRLIMAEIRTEVVREIGHLIICGLQLKTDSYMPVYSPDDVLLITNDDSVDGRDGENAILILDRHFVIARRTVAGGRVGFRSILGDQFYVKDERLDILGYVVGALPDSEVTYGDDRWKIA